MYFRMKKIIAISIVAVVLAISSASGQVRFGVKGGLNVSGLSTDALDTKSATGYHAGLFLALKFSKVAIQPEILWSAQGFTETDALGEVDTDLNYVNIPVMLKIYLVQGLHLELGPTFGILIDAARNSADITEEFASSDISGSFGLGFDAPMGLGGGVRYNIGLTDINNIDGATEAYNSSNFMISIWYALKK